RPHLVLRAWSLVLSPSSVHQSVVRLRSGMDKGPRDRARTENQVPRTKDELSSRRRRVNDGPVPVFYELAVLHAERVVREHFIDLSGLSRRILPVVLVDDRDDVAFGGNDFVRVALWRRRTG